MKKCFYVLFIVSLITLIGCAHQNYSMKQPHGNYSNVGNVYLGIDVLQEKNFSPIAGKRVGLITNHTGFNRDAISDIDILFNSKECKLVALFSPEHGIRGVADEGVSSSKDEKTGLPINSLYGKTSKPTPEMLADIDVLVFDIQDIGARFYTYIGTMAKAMQAAKENHKKFIVLDRPNPIGGLKVEGAVPPIEQCGGLTSIYPIPTQHAMTIGELALMFNDHFKIGCDLEIIPMRNWKRWMYYDQTGLLWRNPSPNMKTLNGAILYSGLGVAESTPLSCGRGLDRPFEIYGAPYLDSAKVVTDLNKRNIPGIRFVEFPFIPTAKYHTFKDQTCQGIFAIITDRDKLRSVTAGLNMIQAIYESHPNDMKPRDGFKSMTGDPNIWKKLANEKMTPEQIVSSWQPEIDKFNKIRKKYLLY